MQIYPYSECAYFLEVHPRTYSFQGEHILQASASGTTVTYFSRSNLSTDALSRFNELFLTRQKWMEEDIVSHERSN